MACGKNSGVFTWFNLLRVAAGLMAANVLPKGSTQMSANPLDLFIAHAGAAARPQAASVSPSDRRKRARIRVHWPVLLFRAETAGVIRSTTQDLSSSGFYFLSNVALMPGDALACTLKVPFHDPNGKHLDRNLECRARVVRVEPQPTDSCFGIACHIEDYHLADFRSATGN